MGLTGQRRCKRVRVAEFYHETHEETRAAADKNAAACIRRGPVVQIVVHRQVEFPSLAQRPGLEQRRWYRIGL